MYANKSDYRVFWNIAKTMLSGRCLTVNACVRKEGKFQISNLASLLNNLDKQEKTKPKRNRKGSSNFKSRNQTVLRYKTNKEN